MVEKLTYRIKFLTYDGCSIRAGYNFAIELFTISDGGKLGFHLCNSVETPNKNYENFQIHLQNEIILHILNEIMIVIQIIICNTENVFRTTIQAEQSNIVSDIAKLSNSKYFLKSPT